MSSLWSLKSRNSQSAHTKFRFISELSSNCHALHSHFALNTHNSPREMRVNFVTFIKWKVCFLLAKYRYGTMRLNRNDSSFIVWYIGFRISDRRSEGMFYLCLIYLSQKSHLCRAILVSDTQLFCFPDFVWPCPKNEGETFTGIYDGMLANIRV
jgi:hypothetical protein